MWQASSDKKFEYAFEKKLSQLSSAFLEKGVRVKPYNESSWRYFYGLSTERKNRVYSNFISYFDIYMPILSRPGSPNEDGRLLWAAIKKYGLHPCSDFFNQMEETDVVEFYSPSGIQIFHNINFFEVCSYTFLEVFTYPFTELWIRDPVTLEITKQVAIDGFSGKFKKTVDANLPQQFIIESFSAEKYIIQVNFRKFSPLYSIDGEIAALASVSQAQVIDPNTYLNILEKYPHLPRVE